MRILVLVSLVMVAACGKKGGVMSAEDVWSLAQKGDGQVGKSFTFTGKVTKVDANFGSVVVAAGAGDLVLWFGDKEVAGKLAPDATLTASCTVKNALPRTVRMEPCTLVKRP